MLYNNNTFFETRTQRLFDGLIFVEKGLEMHVFEKSRVYTLAEILRKCLEKIEGNLGT